MTPTIGWVPGIPSGDRTPFVPADRFKGTGKVWRIWLLGDARCVAVHYCPGQKTRPCLAHQGECPLCDNPVWWKRREAYAPVMLEVRKLPDPHWEPILGVFTAGGYKQLGATPHRGKMFDVSRDGKGGTSPRMVLDLVQVGDPLRPAFDIEPLIKRMWWPEHYGAIEGVVELPATIPIPPEEVRRTPWKPDLRPVNLSPEELLRVAAQAEERGLLNIAREARERAGAVAAEAIAPAPAPPAPPEPPPEPTPAPAVPPAPAPRPAARPSMTPTPEKAIGAIKRRGKQVPEKPAADLTPLEAIDATRVIEYYLADVVRPATIPMNGHAKKGGGK